MKTIISTLCIALGALVLIPTHAHAKDADFTAGLLELIATLTPEQQEGLLVLLSGSADAAKAAGPESAEDALKNSLARFSKMAESGDVDLEPFFARLSEDFNHWGVNGKAGAVQWFEALSGSLFRGGESLIEFDISDVEVEEDGDSAVAYPVRVSTPLGSATLELDARREADGLWRIVGISGL